MTRMLRPKRNVTLLRGAVAIGVISSCFAFSACGSIFNSEAPQRGRGNVVSEHQFLTAAQATKQLGEDCTLYGASECISELCLHYKHDPASGYVCSRKCESDTNCPAGWRCVSTYPSAGSEFCVPPAD